MDNNLVALYQRIAELGKKYQAEKIVLFGSRARGDHRERSDIDLAIFGMSPYSQALFWMDLEEIPTLLKFDVTYVVPDMDKNFLKNIECEGITIYEKDH